MTSDGIADAIAEARRFLKAAEAALAELDADDSRGYWAGTKISAACRRASMDLTRALARMRRA